MFLVTNCTIKSLFTPCVAILVYEFSDPFDTTVGSRHKHTRTHWTTNCSTVRSHSHHTVSEFIHACSFIVSVCLVVSGTPFFCCEITFSSWGAGSPTVVAEIARVCWYERVEYQALCRESVPTMVQRRLKFSAGIVDRRERKREKETLNSHRSWHTSAPLNRLLDLVITWCDA